MTTPAVTDFPSLSAQVVPGLDGATFVFPGSSGTTQEVGASELAEASRTLHGGIGGAKSLGAYLTNDPGSVALLLDAILNGFRLVSLPPPPRRRADLASYVEWVGKICGSHGVEQIVARPDLAALGVAVGLPMVSHSMLTDGSVTVNKRAFELVQFTSGTTGVPAAVPMTDQALGNNVGRILSVLDPRDGDNTVSWLPLSHDMGLVGMVLASLAAAQTVGNGHIVLMRPEDFVRKPEIWLRAVAEWRGTVTAAPDFGYRIASRTGFEGDLSSLRCAIVGGEVVRISTLHSFARATKGSGFVETALCPAYGLAEVGVAATLTPPGVRWREAPVEHLTGRIKDANAPMRLISSGPPLPGHRVRAGPAGESPERIEVAVGAPSDCRTVTTSDIGFTDEDGWLYVVGREDDFVVLHGRNTYAPAVETAVEDVPGVRAGHVALTVMPTGEVVFFCEVEEGVATTQREVIMREIRRICVDVASTRPDHVQFVDRGVLPFTSSGKLQRSRIPQVAALLP